MKTEKVKRVLEDAKYHHVSEDLLVSYRDRQLDAISRTQIEAHLDLCWICERHLLRLRAESAALDHYEPHPNDDVLVKRATQQAGRDHPQNSATTEAPGRATALDRFIDQLRQAAASWRAFVTPLEPVRGATPGGTEIWRWQSEDKGFVAYAVVELNADLTLHFVTRNLESEGKRLKVKVGSRDQEAVFQRVSESESRAEVNIKRRQRPRRLKDIFIEVP
jgi:hypothetical protein